MKSAGGVERTGGRVKRAAARPAEDATVRRLALRLNGVACGAVLAAILCYCFAEEGEQLLALISTITCVVAWRLGRGRRTEGGFVTARPITLPKQLVNALVLAALLNAAFRVIGSESRTGPPIVSVLAQFLVYIQLIKLFDRRSPRDDGHMLGLSVFVAIGAILTSNQLAVGAMLLVYTSLTIAAAMMLQLLAGYRAAAEAEGREGTAGWGGAEGAGDGVPAAFVVGVASSRDFRRAGVVSFVLIIGMASAAFVLTPRGLGENILGAFGRVGAGSRIGFTDNVQLGRSGRLSADETPVMDVRVYDSAEQNIGEQVGTVYLRGTVNNVYNGVTRSWMFQPAISRRMGLNSLGVPESDGPGGSLELEPGVPKRLARGAIPAGLTTQEITFRRRNVRGAYLFSAWRPIEVSDVSRPLTIQWLGREVILKLAPTDEEHGILSYRIRSAAEYTDPRDSGRSVVSFESERVGELARRIVADRGIIGEATDWAPDVVRRAVLALQEHLRTTCVYSLEQIPPDDREDPIEMFLFRTQQGHCEYFASALVAMCQSLGVDARIVAGYLAAEFDAGSGAFIVRESNAHAWVEVRLAPGRWQPFDPSPPEEVGRQHRGSGGVFARLRRLYDAINFTWTSAVISFDRSKQSGLMGSRERESMERWSDRLYAFNVRNWLMNLSGRRVVVWVVVSVGVVGVLWAVRRYGPVVARRVTAPRGRAARAAPDAHMRQLLEQAGFYSRLLRVLRQAGLEKPASTPPLTHAAAVRRTSVSAGADVELLARLYYQVRFGRAALGAEELAQAESALGRVERWSREDARGVSEGGARA